jgi:hypothetical protein
VPCALSLIDGSNASQGWMLMGGKQRRMVEGLEGFSWSLAVRRCCALPLRIEGGVSLVDREARHTPPVLRVELIRLVSHYSTTGAIINSPRCW